MPAPRAGHWQSALVGVARGWTKPPCPDICPRPSRRHRSAVGHGQLALPGALIVLHLAVIGGAVGIGDLAGAVLDALHPAAFIAIAVRLGQHALPSCSAFRKPPS